MAAPVFFFQVLYGLDAQILNSMMDEQYLVGLADKVHRGQEGPALKGLQPGGKCYGYTNVPIEDLTRHGKIWVSCRERS
jgi:hypothetical protein